MEPKANIVANLDALRRRLADAAEKSGRSANEITLVAVTKYVPEDVAQLLVDCGCYHLGESRPQSLWQKHQAIDEPKLRWHLIGPLQTNKARRTVGIENLALIHSIDRLGLLDRLESESERLNKTLDVLLQVRISSDPEKQGFAVSELEFALTHCLNQKHLRLRGLMGMASRTTDQAQVQREFEQLRVLKDKHADQLDCQSQLQELSMGMSHDFELAIASGATIVRIGSLLFTGLT